MKLTISLLALVGLASAGTKLPPIKAKGSKFFYPDGTQFFCKGIAYQRDVGAAGAKSDPTAKYMDPLADEESCRRDVPLLEELGVNCIRTYAINPTANHTTCLSLLEDANIYIFSDLSEPATSINRDEPVWNTRHYQRYKDVIDVLAPHTNVIGFFAGNEVSNEAKNTGASAFVKRAVSDSKSYIKQNFDRWIGVGYAANDDAAIRADIANYFNCGDQEDSIDFWGHNIYSWCGNSTIEESGYDKQAEFFKTYNVPVFFAEFGCNQPDGGKSRTWTDADALLNDPIMTDVFSGGIVYMYFQEKNDYGVVNIENGRAVKRPDFDRLKRAYTSARPQGVLYKDYKPSAEPAECPKISENWNADAQLPPTPDADLCNCMVEASECALTDNYNEKSYGKLFGEVCGMDRKACAGIDGNTTLGNYGTYSMCMPAEQLTYVLDSYYRSHGKNSDACRWPGAATRSATSNSSCDSGMKQAEDYNKRIAGAKTSIAKNKTSSDDDSMGTHSAPLGILVTGAVGLAAVMLF